MRLHLVDGTFELFRAHYAKRPDQPLKATKGLVNSLLALARDPEEQLTHVAVAFDNPIRSFRNDLFAGYKTEVGIDPVLFAQFDGAEAAVRSIGMVVWSMQEFEADDALASAAARWGPDVAHVRILTPDKDLGQCVRGTQVVQVDRIRKRVIDEAGLWAAKGVRPASVPDWLALMGDTADGVPGLTGFGAKGAAALLAEFSHLENIPADPRAWPPTVRGAERLAASFAANRAEAFLYRRLTTLRTDVPLAESLDALRWAPPVATSPRTRP